MVRMRWYQHITYNIYWLGLNMASGSLTPVILPYLVARFVGDATKGTYLGMLRSAGLVIAILVQPTAGLLSDRSALRAGRRRPFIVLGTALDLVFLVVIGLAGDYWLLFAAVLALQFSSNIAHGALQGIIPDLVPEDQRGRASAVKAVMELLPIILVGFTVGPLVGTGRIWEAILLVIAFLAASAIVTVVGVREAPGAPSSRSSLRPALQRILLLTGIFTLVTSLFGGLVGATGRLLSGKGTLQLAGVAVAGLLAMAGAIVLGVWWSAQIGIGEGAKQYPGYTWWVVNRLLYLAAVGSVQSFAQYFLRDVLQVSNAPAATSTLMMVVGIFTVASALPSGWLADRVGKRQLVAAAGVVAAAGTFLLFFAGGMAMVTLCGVIIGLSAGIFMTVSWALGTDLVPREEAGLYLGVSNLAGAGAGIVGAGIGGPMADFFNAFRPGLGYLTIFGIYGALFLLSAATVAKVHGER
jgi:MFS family permease